MKTILCVRLLNWPVDRVLRKWRLREVQSRQTGTEARRHEGKEEASSTSCLRASAPSCLHPFAITRTIATRQVILAVSVAAANRGIKPGMTLAQARALYSQIEHVEHEPHRDALALEALARWMMQFSPVVALQLAGSGGTDIPVCVSGSARQSETQTGMSMPPSPSGIWLDLTGTERLFGPAEKILQTIDASLRSWGVTARLAIAPTPGAAWAMTFEYRHKGTKELEEGAEAFPLLVLREGVGGRVRARSAPFANSPSPSPPPGVPGGGVERATSCLCASVPSCLPIHSLRLPPDIVAALHHLGIRTIDQLRKLPREQLPARFGSILLTRLNQLDGIIEEPLVPIEPTSPISAHRRWEQPVESLEWVWPIAQELIEQIADKLLRRGHGAREVRATLRLALGEPIERTIRFSRPTREPKRMLELLRQAVEGVNQARRHGGTKARSECVEGDLHSNSPSWYSGRGPGGGQVGERRTSRSNPPPNPLPEYKEGEKIAPLRAYVPSRLRALSAPHLPTSSQLPSDLSAFDYNGFIAVRFDVLRSQRIVTEQIELGQTESFEGQVDLDDLIERLRVRMDQPGVAQAQPVESHVPERGFVLVEAWGAEEAERHRDGETKRRRDGVVKRQGDDCNSSGFHFVSPSLRLSVSSSVHLLPPIRPLLLHPPHELRVIVTPSHDRDGRPVSVTDPRGNVHRVVHAVGPERICGEWWTGHDKSRDYFDIELPDARRWWIFRVNESGRWFWQGEF